MDLGPDVTIRHLAVDAAGYVWRVFPDGTWSMARVNPDNSPVPHPVTFFVPETTTPPARSGLLSEALEKVGPPTLPVTHREGDEAVLHADVGHVGREHVLSRDCWCGPQVVKVEGAE